MELDVDALPLWDILCMTRDKIAAQGDYDHPAAAECDRLELLLHQLEHTYEAPSYSPQ